MDAIDTLDKLLTDKNITRAFACGVINFCPNLDDSTAVLNFCHAGDPDGEYSFISTEAMFHDVADMDDEDRADWVRDSIISLAEDDPDSYEDEMLFYANLIAES